MSVRRWVLVCTAAILAAPRLLVAQPVGVEFQVNTVTLNGQTYPNVAFDADGDFVVVWGTYISPLANEVHGQRYSSAGAPLGTEFPVNAYTTDTQHHPAVAAEANGDFVVVWQSNAQEGSLGYGIFGRRFASGGAPIGADFQVNTYTYANQFDAVIASDSAGAFVVVWSSTMGQDGNGYGLFGQRFDSSGAPIGADFQVNTATLGNQQLAAITSKGDGAFVVVWTGVQDGDGYGVVGQRFASDGTKVGGEFQVNSHTVSTQFAPSVSEESNGDFVVAWVSYYQDGGTSGVFGQRYASSGAAIGGEFQINSHTQGYQRFTSVASDASGGFAVIWESQNQDGSSYGVFGQRFSNDGSPSGAEFQVNTYTYNRQERPMLASAPDGAFVVTWQSKYQEGIQHGIFAQRYAAPPPCPPAPDGGCTTGFGKGLFLIKEKVAGKEKLIAKFLKGPSTAQIDFGNPLASGGTRYNLCIYADSSLVSNLEVDRAADATCSGGSTACWVDVGGAPPGGKGYKYKDDDAAADGVSQIQLKSGAAKILVKGRGTNLPLPIASSLTAAASVTLQLRGNDAPQCFGVTLSDFKAQDADFVKVK